MAGMILIDGGDVDCVLVRGVKMRVNRRRKYCLCGHEGDLVCDWKVTPDKTCDYVLCAKCCLEVGPDKHLCPYHARAYEQWKKRHPDKVPQIAEQMRLGL